MSEKRHNAQNACMDWDEKVAAPWKTQLQEPQTSLTTFTLLTQEQTMTGLDLGGGVESKSLLPCVAAKIAVSLVS